MDVTLSFGSICQGQGNFPFPGSDNFGNSLANRLATAIAWALPSVGQRLEGRNFRLSNQDLQSYHTLYLEASECDSCAQSCLVLELGPQIATGEF